MNWKMLWIYILFMAFTAISESKEFCETFVRNDHRIGFIFRRMLVTPPERITFNLFIGSQYWRLKSSDSSEDFGLDFEDPNRESKDSNLGDDYRMGTSFTGENLNILTGGALFISGSKQVFANISGDDHKEVKDLIEYKVIKETIDGENITIPGDFAFSGINKRGFASVFIVEKASKDVTDGWNYTQYMVSVTDGLLFGGSGKMFKVFKDIKQDIIGVHSMPDTKLSHLILILMSDGNRVLFCVTPFDKEAVLSPRCKTPKTLIDCSEKADSSPSTEYSENSQGEHTSGSTMPLDTTKLSSQNSNKTLLLVLILIVIAVIVGLIVVIIYFYWKCKTASKDSNDSEVISNQVLAKSKDSGLTQSKIASKSKISSGV